MLKAVCKGTEIGFTLKEFSQGSLTVTFAPGTDRAYCMEFGGTIEKDKRAEYGKVGKFKAKDAPAPLVCPIP